MTPDGFAGQRLQVLPRPLVHWARQRAPLTRLLVTDAGHFPRAGSHGRQRPDGAPEAVVIVCTSGRGSCETLGRVTWVKAGEALVLPPRVAHLYRADAADPWTIWWLHVDGDDVASLLQPLAGERLVRVRDVFRAVAAIEHVVECLERDESEPSLVMASGLAWSLLAQLGADHLAGGREQVEPIRAAKDHLRDHLAEPVRVAELARLAGLSPSHFSALFRRANGAGVTAYVKSRRMARARELLLTSDLPVRAVGEAVGYPDPFYFSRQFHAVHACSPTSYRQQAEQERV